MVSLGLESEMNILVTNVSINGCAHLHLITKGK